MKPTLSVITPVFNGENYVTAALESIRSQQADDIEVIVIDDGSTDRTVEVVRDFSSKNQLNVKLLTPGRLGNWIAATNLGLRQAQGEWACFLHHDDQWLPGRMDATRRDIDKARGVMILSDAIFVGPDGRYLGDWTCPLSATEVPSLKAIEPLLIQNYIAICAPVFKRQFVLDTGGLDESLWHTADWDLWLRLAAAGPVRFTQKKLTAVRVHPESITVSRAIKPGEWMRTLTDVIDRHVASFDVPPARKHKVLRYAMLNAEVNTALSTAVRGGSVNWATLIFKLAALGPLGWHRYLRDTRFVQRVGARLKVRNALKDRHRPRQPDVLIGAQ